MMKTTEKIFNVITGKEIIIERDETAAETKERLDWIKEITAQAAEAEAAATQKAALLARLGITADEAKLLIG